MKFSKDVWLVLVPFTDKENAERLSKGLSYSTYVVKVSRKQYHKLKEKQERTKDD